MILAPHLLSPAWIAENGWRAILVEDKPDELTCYRIARDAIDRGVTECIVCQNDDFFNAVKERHELTLPDAFRIAVSPEALADLTDTPHLWHYVLFPEDRSFAMLQASNWFIVAGPIDFVEQAIGSSTDEAWTRFERYANEEVSLAQPEGRIAMRAMREYRNLGSAGTGALSAPC